MSEHVTLTAEDGHRLDAYVAHPVSEPIAALIVIQEIFGVNAHIRAVTDGFAKDGFLAVAPALFDRFEPGVELDYDKEGRKEAMSLVPKIDFAKSLLDVKAAMEYAATDARKKIGVVGYCLGGSLAWLSATRLGAAAAVGYYGGRIGSLADEELNVPVMLHFGKEDTHIPLSDVEKVRAAHPDVEIFVYENAGHAFNRDVGESYNPDAAREARRRSIEFLKKHLA